MSAQHFFVVPFALSGDKTAIPDPAQGTGDLSYTEGFGIDYEKDPATEPDAKRIPRDQTNQLYFDITSNLRQYQLNGVPEYVTAAQNGGSPVAYELDAYVRFDTGGGVWGVFASLVTANTADPSDATKWRRVNPFSAAFYTASNADLQATATAKTNVFVTPAALIRTYREGRWDNLGAVVIAGGNALSATYADGGAFSPIAGAQVAFRVPTATTNPNATLNVNAGGALPLYNSQGAQLAAGDLQPDRVYKAICNSVAWFLQSPVASQFQTYGAATDTTAGIIRIATTGEANALASNSVALTPDNLPTASTTQIGALRFATTPEANALTATGVALSPGNIPLATQTQGGVLRFATGPETLARVSTTLAISPATAEAALPPRLRWAPASAGSAITNWNQATEAGWYYAAGAANSPPGLTAVNVMVEAVDGNTLSQIATSISVASGGNTNRYQRTLVGGVWSAWWRIYGSLAEIQASVTVPNRLAANSLTATPLPTDWDAVLDAGWYYQAGAANGPAPLAGNGLSVEVRNLGAGNVMQTATAIAVATEADTQTYRRYFTGTWGAWFKIIQSVAEAQAAAGPVAGDVKAQAHTTVDAGWYLCDGSAKSRATDAPLFARIGVAFGAGNGSTTFNIPDYRGVTLRGLDDGRGLDPGRAMGSYQADAFQTHTHQALWATSPGSANDLSSPGGMMTDAVTTLNNSATIQSAGTASETRMKNTTAVFVIKR